jgi:hypothetical protein
MLRGLVAAGVSVLTAAAGLGVGATPVRAVDSAQPYPMMLQNVSMQDLSVNRNGICDGSFQILIKNVGATVPLGNPVQYLDLAQRCGMKVIFHFTGTVSGGTVYPERVARWVNAVKDHPSLAGYLTVKEPSWIGINGSEIRAMYAAFKAADPNHPVYALFGDIPHFGDRINPYTAGMADVVMVDWYPVETVSGGCSRIGSTYVATGPKSYAKVRNAVAAATPGTQIVAMLQTHKYLAAWCHKKQLPTKAQMWRQAREALTYAGVSGFAFHTWSNVNYQMDLVRNPTMLGWLRQLGAQLHDGTFR